MSNQVLDLERQELVITGGHANAPVGKILVVDDEPELRMVLVESLQRHGYQVTGCGSGYDALVEIRAQEFDLLLTDLMMPEMDGIALLKAALEISPHLIGIILTGQGTIQTAVNAMQIGALDYVLKPFRMQNLLPVLTRALNTRQLRLENLQLRETVAIHELTQTIAFTLDPQTVMSKLTEAALQQTEADEVSVLLPTADGQEFFVAAARGTQIERLLGERIPFERSIASWVARERTPLILHGEVHDDRFEALWPRPDIRSSVSVPMVVGNKLIGVLNVNAVSRKRPFALGQMKALSILAGTAATALESASLYTQVLTTEEKYRSIFENATEGLFQSTVQGRLLTANPALARILGYDSPEETINSLTDVTNQLYVSPEARTDAGRLQDETGPLVGFEMEFYRKGGEKIWVSMNRRALRNQEGKVLYFEGSVEDITKRRQAETLQARLDAEIRAQRERLDTIVASVPGVVFESWSGNPAVPASRSNFVSEYIEAMLGYTAAEWLSAPDFWLTAVHADDRERVERETAASFASGSKGELEFRWIGKDKRTVWVRAYTIIIRDHEGNSIGTRGVVTDITAAKFAEQALQETVRSKAESLALLNTILSSAPIGFAFHDRNLVYQRINGSLAAINGLSVEAHLGKTLSEVLPEMSLVLEPLLRRVIDTGESILDHEIIGASQAGTAQSHWLVSFYPVRMQGGELLGVGVLVSDITDRKQAEKALNESEERYRDLVENAHDLIYEHDLKGNYTAANAAGELITGYSLEESLKLNLLQTVDPESLERAKEMMRRKLAGESVTAYELVIIAKDGHHVPVEVNTRLVLKNGVPVGVQGIARDIAERKRVEQELRDSEARYRLLFDTNPQPMWVYDLETLSFLAVNESAVHHYGYSRDEFLSMTIKDIRPADDLPARYDAVASSSAGLNEEGMWRHLRKDGAIIEVEITSHFLVFDGRRAELVLANDITERNRLKAALLASEEQLRQSQKLEAIGQLAGGIAHDFNNLLTVIGGYSSILLNKLGDDNALRGNVQEIKKASDRAGGLTRQLLAFSRKQILQPKILDLNAVVSDLDKMVRRLIGEDIDLLTITDPHLGKVKADPGQIEQVLLNLIVNARDAMPDGGKLTIETTNATLSDDYALSHAAVGGPFVMLAVSDSGCGMDAELQSHAFEPFFTTKVAGKGTGLGLATVYGIVKQSDGHIWIYSEPGKGTSFKIYLPCVDEIVSEHGNSGRLQAPKGTETLLLVEDEDQVREIVRAIFEQQGYEVLVAANGEEALSLAKLHGARIHLLMTDVVMPQMSGRELAEKLTAIRPKLKVLYMSGYTDDAIVRHGLLAASLNFLQKPFDAATAARKVREVLDAPVL